MTTPHDDKAREAFENVLRTLWPNIALARQQRKPDLYAHDEVQAAWENYRRSALSAEAAKPTGEPNFERMFLAACADLGLVNEALDLDPDDGGAEPILSAIKELKSRIATPIEPLTDAEIDLIVADGMRNVQGGIYESCVYRFAREVQRAAVGSRNLSCRDDGECRSCVAGKCTTGAECVTLGRDAAPVSEKAIRELEKQNADLVATLQGIANADWRTWEELASPHEFVRWAKARANHAIANAHADLKSSPSEAQQEGGKA
jgi:hypothetical protein